MTIGISTPADVDGVLIPVVTRRARALRRGRRPFHHLDYLEDLRDPRPVKEIRVICVA